MINITILWLIIILISVIYEVSESEREIGTDLNEEAEGGGKESEWVRKKKLIDR